jgi:carbamoyl-phosphate synthase large subunit
VVRNIFNPKHKHVLVTSISKKVPLLKTLKKAVEKVDNSARLYGADTNQTCIGSFFVDGFWPMPSLQKLNIDDLIRSCHEHQIAYIIPTRDGELPYFAQHKTLLAKNGIYVMVSELESVEVCLDKLKFYKRLCEIHYPAIKTVNNIEEISSQRYVVKGQFGAGGNGVGLNLTKDAAKIHASRLKHPIFQPFTKGNEVSVDLYVDSKGKTKGVIVRTRELVVNGESQITTTVKNEELERMCTRLAEVLGLYGHAMFQIIIDENKQYHFVECNCRFGGASRLSVEAGLDSFYWFLLEASGHNLKQIPFNRTEEEKQLIRYPEDLIL